MNLIKKTRTLHLSLQNLVQILSGSENDVIFRLFTSDGQFVEHKFRQMMTDECGVEHFATQVFGN